MEFLYHFSGAITSPQRKPSASLDFGERGR